MKEFDRWAKTYDLVYKEYKKDIGFYKKEAKKTKGKVLEIACGTGRIYLELLKDKVDAYGIDISGKMLEVLKKKAKKLKLKPKVKKADMRNFKLKQKFPLIIIPFRAFLHNLTIEDQLKTLETIKKHLLPNGKIILNFFYPNIHKLITKYGKLHKTGTIKTKEGNYDIINKSYFIDIPNQVVEFNEILKKKNKLIWKEKFKVALIYKREFELLLKLAGFKKWKVYGGYNYKPLKTYKQEMIWVIEK